ncbi:DUF2974 domain-containing protein [Bifidobacterium sp. MA2]|uniref:DUF2974 domain-containing protein n=1 Tax=Bifidobacterium santillanense TaxID=2809028 RepID=A0ABS5URE6_9BIFI|nr:DUF2974 domain-containing protein [Bifidobacterium santillanense]MBT1173401.1 DUF2974 domain-containing protein [Bifidobacterium santillanense]
MGNITDDIRVRFDTFDASPFNETDSLALSQLAYARMPDNVPRYRPAVATEMGDGSDADGEADGGGTADDGESGLPTVPLRDLLRAECYDAMFGRVWSPQLNVDLLRAMAESPRWRALRVGAYADVIDVDAVKQFAACSFDLGDIGTSGACDPGSRTLYVAFRGTDSSIVGWKEDFAMAFRRPVASQESAVRYLTDVASRWDGPIMVGGHSKGGNLAVYAAACAPADVRERIAAVYSHDGPGFDEAFFATPGYEDIASRVHKSVPEASIIGMLFESREDAADGYTVVGSDGVGIMQHFALHWQVEHGTFVLADGLNAGARYAARTLNDWMARYDDEHRRLFIEGLFAVLEAGGRAVAPDGAHATFGELSSHWTQALPVMLAAARGIDPEDRAVMFDVLKGFAATAATSVAAVIPAGR